MSIKNNEEDNKKKESLLNTSENDIQAANENNENNNNNNNDNKDEEWIPLTADRGVLKKILVEGLGDDTPPEGANVVCHYIGTLVSNGNKFDSSRDRNSPFNFPIGRGKVIKGWDIGIASMKKQEKCILRCRYDYAYGDQGHGDIPAKADLDFEVELLEWDEWHDVKGNGSLMRRKIQTTDDDYNAPQEFAICKISYTGKVFDTGVVFIQGENDEITLQDDERFPPGFHDAVMEMMVGEESEFKMYPSLAFGNKGNEALKVPPNAVLSYVIKLQSVKNPPELWDLSTEAHFSETEKLKATGNEVFKKGEYRPAIKKYERALKIIKDDGNFNDEEKKSAKALESTLNSNLALAYFKLQEYSESLNKINEVLNEDSNNVKALVRRGQAHMMLGNNDLAKKDLRKALELDPNNADVKKLIETNKKRIQQHREKERKLFGNMFATKSKKKPNKTENTASETTKSKIEEETMPTTNTTESTEK